MIRQLIRMNWAFVCLGLICLQLVQGAEGSVGQNIQYPQVCARNMQVTLSFPEYLVLELVLAFTNTKAYFCALPPLWALFALFLANSGQIISLLARDASGS